MIVAICAHVCLGVLIAPLWNWNNGLIDLWAQMYCVLIAPLWNWNSATQSYSCPGISVLIAPLWNWNLANWLNLFISPAGSNRTFMELKWTPWHRVRHRRYVLIAPLWNWNLGAWGGRNMQSAVLIAPLWNWNQNGSNQWAKVVCSNRTFMELKLIFEDRAEAIEAGF